MNKALKAPVLGALLLCLAASAVHGQDFGIEIAAQERARHDLEGVIRQYSETAGQKFQQALGLQARLSDLWQSYHIAQQQIAHLEQQSRRFQGSINALNIEMDDASRQISTLLNKLRLRTVDIHKNRAREELHVLLSAESAHEAVTSAFLLERLAQRDRLAIEELANKIAELGHGKRNIESNRSRLIARTEELNNQRERYSAFIRQTAEMLSRVQRERQTAEFAAEETRRAQIEIERTVAELAHREAEYLQGMPLAVNSGANIYSIEELQAHLALGREVLFDWPVRGSIADHYGLRVHPIYQVKSFNSGIGISAPPGTQVKAAGPGRVLYEGWLYGFGQVVVIDHGRNISTVYAHLASTRVRENDTVVSGTVIGIVGSAGTTAGYGLHFEVRVGDVARNPLDYLRRI